MFLFLFLFRVRFRRACALAPFALALAFASTFSSVPFHIPHRCSCPDSLQLVARPRPRPSAAAHGTPRLSLSLSRSYGYPTQYDPSYFLAPVHVSRLVHNVNDLHTSVCLCGLCVVRTARGITYTYMPSAVAREQAVHNNEPHAAKRAVWARGRCRVYVCIMDNGRVRRTVFPRSRRGRTVRAARGAGVPGAYLGEEDVAG
ncbi:hypothetical protein C2E23DRAFT_380086 [Lenzites betulinus]|nr:hypothetical protein C2E23DRAFT_380086 [Lenzites betulinus]